MILLDDSYLKKINSRIEMVHNIFFQSFIEIYLRYQCFKNNLFKMANNFSDYLAKTLLFSFLLKVLTLSNNL